MTQTEIIQACTHTDRYQAETTAGKCCNECWNLSVAARRAARKAQLNAMPRCQVEGCKMRASLKVGSYNPVGMCGRHFKIANAKVQAQNGGMFWLSYEITGAAVLELFKVKKGGE